MIYAFWSAIQYPAGASPTKWIARDLLRTGASDEAVAAVLRHGSPGFPRRHADPEDYIRDYPISKTPPCSSQGGLTANKKLRIKPAITVTRSVGKIVARYTGRDALALVHIAFLHSD
jgi:hypothetical protein